MKYLKLFITTLLFSVIKNQSEDNNTQIKKSKEKVMKSEVYSWLSHDK
jgi:hypothetical protein